MTFPKLLRELFTLKKCAIILYGVLAGAALHVFVLISNALIFTDASCPPRGQLSLPRLQTGLLRRLEAQGLS